MRVTFDLEDDELNDVVVQVILDSLRAIESLCDPAFKDTWEGLMVSLAYYANKDQLEELEHRNINKDWEAILLEDS